MFRIYSCDTEERWSLSLFVSWSVTLFPSSVNPCPCWYLPPERISTLSWALKIIRTAKVPQKILCEQTLCFQDFAVVQNVVAPPTKIANLLQTVRICADLTCTLSTVVMEVKRDLEQMPKCTTKRRYWKGWYIFIPILLQGRMTNYQAGLLIFNYVLWTLLAFFQRTNFYKVDYWFQSVQRNALPINYLFWQF